MGEISEERGLGEEEGGTPDLMEPHCKIIILK